MVNYGEYYVGNYFAHSGIKGMKWGFSDGVKNGNRTAYEREASANAASSVMTYSNNSKDKQKAKEQYESDVREIANSTSEHDPIYYASHAVGASIKEGKDFIESLFNKK